MRTWRGYNILDLIFILSGSTTVVVLALVFGSKWYIIVNTLLGLAYVFTQAKGKIATQFLGIIYFCFYIFICYTQKYYGEALVYLIVMMPMYIYGTIHWLANKSQEKSIVKIRHNLSKKEWLIASPCFAAVGMAIFFILRALDTNQLILNTLSFATLVPAVYLLARRCKYNHLAFLVNDFIVPFLWIFLTIENGLAFLPMCIYHIFQITYDIYGLILWSKLEKQQTNLTKSEKTNEV